MAKPSSVDWKPIKTEYVTTKVSYRQLSEKYGVSTGLISKVSVREHWAEQRERFSTNCMKKAEKKAEEREVNRLARLITATTKAIDVAMEAFEDDQQFTKYFVDRKETYAQPVELEDGTLIHEREWTEERTFTKIDTKALKDLTGVLKDLTGLMRDFYNIPTPAQAEAQRIAAARLEMEQKKASGDQTGENSSLEIAGLPERYKV